MEQAEPKVSIIIPVYNTEAYVRQAIESILQQTLQELEVIVVNDGSTDGSAAILHELARKDGRVQVVEQENQGQSVARNTGLSRAKGRYIYFMDSDDLLEADALSQCYDRCEAESLDFVFFDADNFCENETAEFFFNYKRTGHLRQGVYSGIDMLNIQLGTFQYTCSVCLNVIRRELLTRLSLRFHPGILHEDQLFTTLMYLQASKVSFISQPFFHRRVRRNSVMTSRFAWRNMEGYLVVATKLLQYSKNETPATQSTIHLLLQQMLDAALWQAHVMPLPDRIKAIYRYNESHLMRFIKMKTIAALLFRKYKDAKHNIK